MALFEKPFMSVNELTETGLPREALLRLAKIEEVGAIQLCNQNGKTAINSKYIFNTQKLENYLNTHKNI